MLLKIAGYVKVPAGLATNRRLQGALAGLAAGVLLTSGVAVGAINAASPKPGVIHGCVSNRTRVLTVPRTGRCPRGMMSLSWNRSGPGGPQGPAGIPGWGRIISGFPYHFAGPFDMAFSRGDIWVANLTGNSLTELDASTGAFVRSVSGSSFKFSKPVRILAVGADIWVVNQGSNSVTEVNARTGAFIRNISASKYHFNIPQPLVSDGKDIWVGNLAGSVTELNASTGAFVRNISGSGYNFSIPEWLSATATSGSATAVIIR